ncbi:MAG: cation diffusion facilitator family transporter [Planctomycetales bacterium]|nr:cation diffusion facilitator family transporter [Planctomycetales bacterium]
MAADEARNRSRAVGAALAGALVLAAAKLATAIATGSLSVLASFLDSVMDVFATTVNWVAIRVAARPADRDHAYGHGKAESLAGLFQGAVIGISGAGLLVESVRRLVAGSAVERPALGIAVMAFALAVTGAVVFRLRAALRGADSLALRAELVHYASDFVVNGAALGALVVQLATGLSWPDAVVSAALAIWILRSGARIFRESVDVLMDREVAPEEVVEQVSRALEPFPEIHAFHSLRTRRSGNLKFVDLHLDIARDLTFARAHSLAEQAIVAVQRAIPGTTAWVHADPWPPDPGEIVDGASVGRVMLPGRGASP